MKKLKISLIVLSLVAFACGGADESEEISVDTTTSTTTTILASEPDIGEVYDESELRKVGAHASWSCLRTRSFWPTSGG